MDKILVKLYVPTIEKIYDVWLPINKKVHTIIYLLTKAINDLNDGSFNSKNLPQLYDRLTAEKYDISLTIKETNIRNGTEIVLI